MADLNVNIKSLKLKNPVLTASGTFGFGEEYNDFLDLNALGGFIVKGTTLHERQGNPYPRMVETPSGMLNAVGLQNKGCDYFVNNIYPRIKDYNTNVIVNASGACESDYVELCSRLNELEKIPAIELNISCPNVKQGGMAFGTSPQSAHDIVSKCREVYDKTLIVKLSPNVTSIADIAKAVESAGADSVSLTNTFLGMSIDIEKQKPYLSTITGGLSGPCIRPIAVRMVWQVANAVKIPVIGLGGIMNGRDAVEFLLAGATAIEVGTANFVNPSVTMQIIAFIDEYLNRFGCKTVTEIIGAMKQ